MTKEEHIEINGACLWTARQGAGEPIVLCHGGPGAYDTLGPVAAMLEDHFTVLRYDQRGSGRSPADGPFTVAGFVADLDELRHHFGWDRWLVVGHSWGADLGLIYALTHPQRTRALVYMSGTGIDPSWHAIYRRNRLAALSKKEQEEFAQLTRARSLAQGDELIRIQKRRSYLSRLSDVFDPSNVNRLPTYETYSVSYRVNQEVGADYTQNYENDRAFHQKVAESTVPFLALHGEADPRSFVFAQKLAGQVKQGEFRMIERAGHFPWLEQPDILRRELRNWLKTISN